MAAKPVFTEEQHEIIRLAAQRVFRKHFKDQSRTPQIKMALALGISQQSVSKLLSGVYRPSIKVATELAILDDKESLEELIGEYATAAGSGLPPASQNGSSAHEPYPNLSTCVAFYSSKQKWNPWTIAAARAGYFGPSDFEAPDWKAKLDSLEKALERNRKTSP
jgi:DNA-binding XRE family transcriptional regulator